MRSKFRALFYNIAVLATVFLGAGALSSAFSPTVGVVYAFFVLFMLYYVLRKHLCTNCVYYGKICYTGWGWLASKLFLKGSGNFGLGLKLAGFVWGVFFFLPFSAFIILGAWRYMIFWIVLVLFFMGDHFGHCASCPMRTRCIKKISKQSETHFLSTVNVKKNKEAESC